MIKVFVSVGTHEVSFDRLCTLAKKLDLPKYEVVVQQGPNEKVIFPKNYVVHDYLNFDEMKKYSNWCDVLVSQASPGLIKLAWQSDALSISMPRRKDLGEHVDNHQFDFAEFIAKMFSTVIINENTNLGQVIDSVIEERDFRIKAQQKTLKLFEKKTQEMRLFAKSIVDDLIKF